MSSWVQREVAQDGGGAKPHESQGEKRTRRAVLLALSSTQITPGPWGRHRLHLFILKNGSCSSCRAITNRGATGVKGNGDFHPGVMGKEQRQGWGNSPPTCLLRRN